jgi:hypothetical protein
MIRSHIVPALFLLTLLCVFSLPAHLRAADENEPKARQLTGTVLDADDQPVPQAVVYLKNMKTQVSVTFITEKDGSFRFHNLSPYIDFQIYAESKGKRSSVKSIGTFDTRANIVVRLRLEK